MTEAAAIWNFLTKLNKSAAYQGTATKFYRDIQRLSNDKNRHQK